MSGSKPDPRDSLKSTWPTWDKATWNFYHWFIHLVNVYPVDPAQDVPVHAKSDKAPHLPQWSQHIWILMHAWPPIMLHQLIFFVERLPSVQVVLFLTGLDRLQPVLVFFLYMTWFDFTIIREVQILRKLGHKHGFLDGDVAPRDGIPDVGVGRIFWSISKTIGGRLALFMLLTYNQNVSPLEAVSQPSWWAWTVVEIGLYALVLDFWFYVYHRAMHDIGPLWRFHRKHHLTKHPNPTLSAYADDEQEVFDMVIVPLLTFFTLRALGIQLGFYEWWVCQQYIVYTEVWGHSGVRVHLTAASTFSPLWTLIGCELAVEDHDLHHRKGYRKSYNYGKQTRVWDRLFGTCHPRIETFAENIDWVNQARMPLW